MVIVVYLRYKNIPKNPILCWVVNCVPLELFFFFLFHSFLYMGVAWADPPGYSTDPADYIQPQLNEGEWVPPIQENEFIPGRIFTFILTSIDRRRSKKRSRLPLFVLDGIPPVHIFIELTRLRAVIFYPLNRDLPPSTLARYVQDP